LSSLALVVALLLTFLQTATARGWIERALEREVNQRLALTMTVGRITGSMIRGIRLEKVALHDAQGRLVARADALSARCRLLRLIRFHEVDEIAVERPVVERLPSAPAGASKGGELPRFTVHRLIIRDGSFRFRGHDVQHLSAISAVHSGTHGVEISTELQGTAFAARGHGEWSDGRLAASLESLDIEPPLAGHGVLHAQGTVRGPPDALEVKLQGHSDDRGLALGALVDVPRRTARLTAFVAAPSRSARLQARAALHGGALDVTEIEGHSGASRISGLAHLDGGGLDAAVVARVAPAEAAEIGIHPAAPVRLRARLHGPTRDLGVHVRGSMLAAQVALTGRVDLGSRRGRVHFVAYNVRPAEIQRGAPPELAFSGAFTFAGALRTGLEGRMSVSDGRLRTSLGSFERLRGTSWVRLGQPGEAYVEELTGQLRGRPIDVQTLIRWDRRALTFDANRAVLDHNHAVGSVVYTNDPVTHQPILTISARRLSLSPSLVQEVVHRRPPKPWSGNAKMVWSPPSGYALSFALDTEEGRMKGAARIRNEGGTLDVPSMALALGESRFRGAARRKNGVIFASVDRLVLQPSLVHSLLPALQPARALEVQGGLAGPLHALDVELLVTAGASTATFRGQVDLPGRSFRLVGDLDNFYLKSINTKGRINLGLAMVGRVVEGGVAGTLRVRHAWGTVQGLPLEAGRLDATLNGRSFNVEQVLIGVPGAVLDGKGGGTFRDFRVKYGVVITDALQLKKVPRELRLIVGLTTLFPGYSVLGSVRRHQGGKIEVTHHTIPPPFRFLSMLAHLLTGRPLHLTVH
jgi:hypothetical protein